MWALFIFKEFNLKGDNSVARKHLSVKQKMRIIEKFGGKCAACGKDGLMVFADILEKCAAIDHIIPLSRGGTNDESNLQLLCRSCNASKGSMTMDEFMEYRMKKADAEHMLSEVYREIPGLAECLQHALKNSGVSMKYDVAKALYDYVNSGR